MLTKELAQKLSDSGFPQRTISEGIQHDGSYIPTLSELIEACGNNVGLFKISETETNVWSRTKGFEDKYFTGSTPEEAVANLWLELNKK